MAIKFGETPKHSGKNSETKGVGHGKGKRVAASKGKIGGKGTGAKSKTQIKNAK